LIVRVSPSNFQSFAHVQSSSQAEKVENFLIELCLVVVVEINVKTNVTQNLIQNCHENKLAHSSQLFPISHFQKKREKACDEELMG